MGRESDRVKECCYLEIMMQCFTRDSCEFFLKVVNS